MTATVKPFAIGKVELDAPVILAPMAGVCDAPYRVIAHRYGAALVCAEMVSSQGIRYRNQHTEELLHIEDGEHPLSMQIFGSDPDVMAQAAAVVEEAGADIVAPSDMMDGRIASIRQALDEEGFINTIIMSYAAKYASGFYGPFRDAAGSAPAFGDRKSYQMDYHNRREGVKEALLDVEEGADIIMVKPAMSYLDVIAEVKENIVLPVAAYSVSGEYAMIKAGASLGYIDEASIICETAASAYRAGVDLYLTYFAKEIAGFMDEGRIG